MNSKKIVMAMVLLLAVSFTTLFGCAAAKDPAPDSGKPGQDQSGGKVSELPAEDKEAAVMQEFEAMAAGKADLPKIKKFVDSNIMSLSQEKAVQVVLALEKIHQDNLAVFQARYFSDDTLPGKFFQEYKPGMDINDTGSFTDQGVKSLITTTRDSGYRVETAEGMLYPVIDYEMYLKYADRVTPDIKAYLGIMARESSSPPAKDAAIIISWDEVLDRAIKQEEFILKFGNSARVGEVKGIFRNYVNFVFLGANNTPLFEYATKVMTDDAREIYEKRAAQGGQGLLAEFASFMEAVRSDDFKLTDRLDRSRKASIEKLTAGLQ